MPKLTRCSVQARPPMAKGDNPTQNVAQHRRAPSIGAFCGRFFETHILKNSNPTRQAKYRFHIETCIKHIIGVFRAVDVERKDVAELHNRHRAIPYQANRSLCVLSKMSSLAENWGLRHDCSNPCRHFPKYR
jgi:hypothetical protein